MEEDEQAQGMQFGLVLGGAKVLQRFGLKPAQLVLTQLGLPEEVEHLPAVVGLGVIAGVAREHRDVRVVPKQCRAGEEEPQLAAGGHPHDPVESVGIRNREVAVLSTLEDMVEHQVVAVLEVDRLARLAEEIEIDRRINLEPRRDRWPEHRVALIPGSHQLAADRRVHGRAFANQYSIDADGSRSDQDLDVPRGVEARQLLGEDLLLTQLVVDGAVSEAKAYGP